MSVASPAHAAVLPAILAVAPGCATAVSLGAAPTVDTRGRFGAESRIEGSVAAGLPTFRLSAQLATGGGYLGAASSSYALLAPGLGVEGGKEIRWSASTAYTPRFLFSGPVRVAHGLGLAGQALFRVAHTGGEHGSLVLGPRLSTDVLFGVGDPARSGDPQGLGLIQLGLVVQWVTFDTTGKSMLR